MPFFLMTGLSVSRSELGYR